MCKGGGSNEQKEEKTSSQAVNTNELVLDERINHMDQFNIHGSTLVAALAASVLLMFILAACFKIVQRRGCFKRHTATSARKCLNCSSVGETQATVTAPRTSKMLTEGRPTSFLPTFWPGVTTPPPPRYSKSMKEERRERKGDKDLRSREPVKKEEIPPMGEEWDGSYKKSEKLTKKN